MSKYFLALFLFLSISILCTPQKIVAGITVFDNATSTNKPVRLSALTKGRFFAEGGKLVKFHLDDKHIGTNLSGGDGYVYLKYTPSSQGLKKLTVETAESKDDGLLLITGEKDKVILIAIEGSLFDSTLFFKPAKGVKQALEAISKRFKIIYLTSLLGVKRARKWLRENDIESYVVFKWEGVEIINELKEKGIHIYAIIGTPDMAADISDIKIFSFKDTEDAEVVTSWEDLLKRLK